jgi:hypothetical protein
MVESVPYERVTPIFSILPREKANGRRSWGVLTPRETMGDRDSTGFNLPEDLLLGDDEILDAQPVDSHRINGGWVAVLGMSRFLRRTTRRKLPQ